MLLRDLLKSDTDRDRQKKIGPSTLGSLCEACIFEGFDGEDEELGKYWLGGRVGTGVHLLAADSAQRLFGQDALVEVKVEIMKLPGYAKRHGFKDDWIRGSADLLVLPNDGPIFPTEYPTLFDWKTTAAPKLPFIQQALTEKPHPSDSPMLRASRFTTRGYLNQMLFYMLGLRRSGYEVKRGSLQFVVRGGSTDRDFFEVWFDYNHERALEVEERARDLFGKWLEDEEPESHEACFVHGER